MVRASRLGYDKTSPGTVHGIGHILQAGEVLTSEEVHIMGDDRRFVAVVGGAEGTRGSVPVDVNGSFVLGVGGEKVGCLKDRANVGVVAVCSIETRELTALAMGHITVGTRWVSDRVRVKSIERVDISGGHGGNEPLEKGSKFLINVSTVGNEDRSLVRVVSRQDRDAQVVPLMPRVNGKNGDDGRRGIGTRQT